MTHLLASCLDVPTKFDGIPSNSCRRNKLLQKYAEGGSFRVDKSDAKLFGTWNEQLVRVGQNNRRTKQVIKQLERFVQYNFTEISGFENAAWHALLKLW